jgi:hypothetical protein
MGKRTGKPRGRPVGSKSKRSQEVADRARKAAAVLAEKIPGCFEGDSHALLMAVYKDPENPLSIRIDAAKAAIGYEKPRLQAIEHTGADGGPIEVEGEVIHKGMTPQQAAEVYARARGRK